MGRRSASEIPPITRTDIYHAATQCFAERGYHGTTMSDIAAVIGIRASSLYNHMPSKQALLQDIVTGTMSEAERVVYPIFDESVDPAKRLSDAVVAHVLHHTHYVRETEIVQSEVASLEPGFREEYVARRRDYAHRWRQLVIDGNGVGVFAAPSAGIASRAIIEMGIAVSKWFTEDGHLTRQQVAEQYAAMALRMVCSKTGIEH